MMSLSNVTHLIFVLILFSLNSCSFRNKESQNQKKNEIILLSDIVGWDCENNRLDIVHDILKKYDKGNVYIHCHTEDRGGYEHNKAISKDIAESIVACLKSKENYQVNIIPVGVGEQFPLVIQSDTIMSNVSFNKGDILNADYISQSDLLKKEVIRNISKRLEIGYILRE